MLRVIIPVIGGNDEDDADDDDDDDNEDARTSEAMHPTLTSCQCPGAHHPRQAPPAAMRMPAPQMQDVTRQAPPTA